MRPQIGLRWGKPADWRGLSAQDEPAEPTGPGGETLLAPIYRSSTKVHQLSPVFRWYDVLRVQSRDDPQVTVEIERTTAVLIPLGQITERRIVGADSSGGRTIPIFAGKKVARYLRLNLSINVAGNFETMGQGTQGEYPNLPVDHV